MAASTTTLAYKKQMTIEEYLRLDREENREKNGKYEFFNQKLYRFQPASMSS